MNKQEIGKKFDTLPEKLKSVIANLDMGAITDELRKKYNLHVDQLGRIAEEITLAMVGLTKVTDFSQKIKDKTGLAQDIVNLIIYDLNQQIFSKIRRELEELSRERAEPVKETEQKQIPPEKIEGSATTPASPGPSATQVFDNKMKTIANVPKQEVAVTPQTGDNKTRDPYREPIV